jgi:hypothetical protein
MKLFRAIKNGYYWTRALQASARDNHQKAFYLLDKVSFRDYEFWTFRAFLLFALSQDKEATIASQKAYKLLESENISVEDKEYLLAYLDRIKSIALGIDLDVSDVNLLGVSEHNLSNFPLRSHPNWKNI